MNSVNAILGDSYMNHPLKTRFLKWQCHVRQIMMRQEEGKPNATIMPDVFIGDNPTSIGAIITIMNKLPLYSETPEMLHMARKTHDPAQRREQALKYFSATFYQKAVHFSDIITATFQPGSEGASMIERAGSCRLVFDAYAQKFDLDCGVERLAEGTALYTSTMAHNRLFNPELPSNTIVLGFQPNWESSTATP